jgi:hypothetical protein
MSQFNVEEIDAKIKIQQAAINACTEQIEALLNHCANISITEKVITQADRQSIEIIFSHVMNQ